MVLTKVLQNTSVAQLLLPLLSLIHAWLVGYQVKRIYQYIRIYILSNWESKLLWCTLSAPVCYKSVSTCDIAGNVPHLKKWK